jgi:uncharacterized OsmC-like protein
LRGEVKGAQQKEYRDPGSFHSADFNDTRCKFRQKTDMTSRIVYEGGLRTTSTHLQSGSLIETDAPTDNQGKGERFSPTDMVGTALAACMLTTMAIRARDMENQLKGMNIEVEKIMASNPRRISRLNIIFHHPPGFTATEEQKRNLENIAMTCPVKQSIHQDIELDIRYNW